MKASDFAKKFGWDSAKKVLEVAPIRATSYRTSENDNTGLGGLFGRIENNYGNIVLLSELKQLIESWKLVEFYGGLDEAKLLHYDEFILDKSYNNLQQAIKDVESCK